MMTITKNVLKILFISLMFSFVACSSDDDNGNNDDDDNEVVAGDDHTYDIELVGEDETVQVSGTIPSASDDNLFSALSVYLLSDPTAEEEHISLTLNLSNENISESVSGIFLLNADRQALLPFAHPDDDDDNPTELVISPAGTDSIYEAVSGTLNFSNVKFYSASVATGLASYTLNFSGVFEDEGGNGFQGSGTIVVNPLEGLSYE